MPADGLVGYVPKNTPQTSEEPKASITDSTDTTVLIKLEVFTSAEMRAPIALPKHTTSIHQSQERGARRKSNSDPSNSRGLPRRRASSMLRPHRIVGRRKWVSHNRTQWRSIEARLELLMRRWSARPRSFAAAHYPPGTCRDKSISDAARHLIADLIGGA